MPFIRIATKGYEKFNGLFGNVEFTDGVSNESVSSGDAARVAAQVTIENVDTGGQMGVAADIVNARLDKAPIEEKLARGTAKVERPAPPAKAPNFEKTAAVAAVLHTALTKLASRSATAHSRESLEAIADKEGIAGLRAIGESLGVKSKTVGELIQKILDAQNQE